MNPNNNVIPAMFEPAFYDEVFMSIKFNGVKRTEKAMIEGGLHPSFVKAAIKRVIRGRGW